MLRKSWNGKYSVFTKCGKKKVSSDPVKYAMKAEELGAGELMLCSIDRDGTMSGYDLSLIEKISESIDIPVIACGGAGNISDLKSAVTLGMASAAAAGSIFVYHGARKGVLINYPTQKELDELFQKE